MEIQKIDHISINAVDFARSIDFYGRLLGFKQLHTVDCGEFDITYFELPGGARLELFDYHGKNPVVTHAEEESGLRHLAFAVRNVAAHEKLLHDAGVRVTLSTCDLPDLEARVLLFLDPNGVTIEFCEKL